MANQGSKMNIHWFPGHMAKARREITEKIKVLLIGNITMGSIWEEIGTGIILNKKDMPEKIFSLQSKLFPVL